MSNDKAPFSWDDPFLTRTQFSEEERLILDSANEYAQEKLLPRVICRILTKMQLIVHAKPASKVSLRHSSECDSVGRSFEQVKDQRDELYKNFEEVVTSVRLSAAQRGAALEEELSRVMADFS